MFVKSCPCPDREPRAHSDMCCGKEMHRVDAGASAEPAQPEAVR